MENEEKAPLNEAEKADPSSPDTGKVEIGFTGHNITELEAYLRARFSALTEQDDNIIGECLREANIQPDSISIEQLAHRRDKSALPVFSTSASSNYGYPAVLAKFFSSRAKPVRIPVSPEISESFESIAQRIEEVLLRSPRNALQLISTELDEELPENVRVLPLVEVDEDDDPRSNLPHANQTLFKKKDSKTWMFANYKKLKTSDLKDLMFELDEQLAEMSDDEDIDRIYMWASSKVPWVVHIDTHTLDTPGHLRDVLYKEGEEPSNATISCIGPPGDNLYKEISDELYHVDVAFQGFADHDLEHLRRYIEAVSSENQYVHVKITTAYDREDATVVVYTQNTDEY